MDIPPFQGAHDLFRSLRRAKKIGVVDGDSARAAVFHLVNHFVDRTVTKFEAVHKRLGAERAALMASA
jgi:hypothetical protein